MSNDLISKKTRYEFREYFVTTTLREIEAEFDIGDVPFDEEYLPQLSGERRTLVEKYYHAVDWKKWGDVRKVLTVYENILSHLEDLIEEMGDSSDSRDEWIRKTFKSLKKWIEKDGYKYDNGRLIAIGKEASLSAISDRATKFDIPELHKQIMRIQNAIEDDPGLAIGTAKELIETTCKTILTDYGVKIKENMNVILLLKEARKHLGLIPESIPNSAKGADTIQRLLSNLGTIAQGISELRNLYGTGHGKHGKTKGLLPRHARLIVGAASTLTMFLLETHEARETKSNGKG